MTQTAAEIWRNYAIQTVPSSGPNQPSKAELRAWGTLMEDLRAGGGSLAYASKALLLADLAHAANVTASVYADATPANNGLYKKTGASGSGTWTRIGDLPGDVIRLSVTGGTGNAIVATATETPTIPGNKLYLLTPSAANTGATTIAVNGGSAVAIKNALGSSLAANSLLEDSTVLMMWSVDHYQILMSVPVDATGVLNDAIAARDDAEDFSVAAASSASALGNQVHQYDTRAQAIAATIPVGVTAIKITRFATGYPLSYATYVPAAGGSGPMAFQEAGGHWWELDLSDGKVNVLWFGARRNGVFVDRPAVLSAQAYVRANGLALCFDPGTYVFDQPTDFVYRNAKILATGPGVKFKYTGGVTERAFTLDGVTYSGGPFSVPHVIWGGAYPIECIGNANCESAFYASMLSFGEINVIASEATNIAIWLFGFVAMSVRAKSSTNVTESDWTTVPVYGIYGDGIFDCTFYDPLVEFVSGIGINFTDTKANMFFGGGAESCGGGGIRFSATSERNNVHSLFFEANGTGPSWDIYDEGDDNIYTSCTSALTEGGVRLMGTNTELRKCRIRDALTMADTAVNAQIVGCNLTGATTISDQGTNTYRLNNTGWSDDYDAYTPGAMVSSVGSITATVSGSKRLEGKIMHFKTTGHVSANSGSGNIRMKLPAPAALDDLIITGYEATGGLPLFGFTTAGSDTLVVRFGDTSYPGAAGNTLIMSGAYPIA